MTDAERINLEAEQADRDKTDAELVKRLKTAGIRYPRLTVEEAHRTHCPLPVLCAVLEQETSGGRNVFGHDPTVCVGLGTVTEKRYRRYKQLRDASRPRRMQGVGPMQLTWFEYQDRADDYGGCWKPRFNIRVGAELLAGLIRRNGIRAALQAYNGSAVYAEKVAGRVDHWRHIIEGGTA